MSSTDATERSLDIAVLSPFPFKKVLISIYMYVCMCVYRMNRDGFQWKVSTKAAVIVVLRVRPLKPLFLYNEMVSNTVLSKLTHRARMKDRLSPLNPHLLFNKIAVFACMLFNKIAV